MAMPPIVPIRARPAPRKAMLPQPPLRATGLSCSMGATASAPTAPPRSMTLSSMLLPLHFAFDDVGDGPCPIAAIVAVRRFIVDAQHHVAATEPELTIDGVDHDEILAHVVRDDRLGPVHVHGKDRGNVGKIGRASVRERVCQDL